MTMDIEYLTIINKNQTYVDRNRSVFHDFCIQRILCYCWNLLDFQSRIV